MFFKIIQLNANLLGKTYHQFNQRFLYLHFLQSLGETSILFSHCLLSGPVENCTISKRLAHLHPFNISLLCFVLFLMLFYSIQFTHQKVDKDFQLKYPKIQRYQTLKKSFHLHELTSTQKNAFTELISLFNAQFYFLNLYYFWIYCDLNPAFLILIFTFLFLLNFNLICFINF